MSNWGRCTLVAAGMGCAGLGAALADMIVAPRRAACSYLVAYIYWLGLVLGGLSWIMIFHVSHARWMVALRRALEALAAPIAAFAPLFLPLAWRLGRLFRWTSHPEPAGTDPRRQLAFHARYLSVDFFYGRAAAYLLLWMVLGYLLLAASWRQDKTGSPLLTLRQRRLSAAGLPILMLTITFAAVDWIMSLQQDWSSTILGFYCAAGALVGSLALWILAAGIASRAGPLAGCLREPHWHLLGALLFGFNCLWAYIAFSQFLLIWLANLPEEISWMVPRMHHGWGGVALFLLVAHFGLPFLVLLVPAARSRPAAVLLAAAWILAAHYVDLYWLVMPGIYPAGPQPRWTDFTAWLGVGGLAVAFGALVMRGRAPLPVRDPFLHASLRYER